VRWTAGRAIWIWRRAIWISGPASWQYIRPAHQDRLIAIKLQVPKSAHSLIQLCRHLGLCASFSFPYGKDVMPLQLFALFRLLRQIAMESVYITSDAQLGIFGVKTAWCDLANDMNMPLKLNSKPQCCQCTGGRLLRYMTRAIYW
jgi:hypothetical protein